MWHLCNLSVSKIQPMTHVPVHTKSVIQTDALFIHRFYVPVDTENIHHTDTQGPVTVSCLFSAQLTRPVSSPHRWVISCQVLISKSTMRIRVFVFISGQLSHSGHLYITTSFADDAPSPRSETCTASSPQCHLQCPLLSRWEMLIHNQLVPLSITLIGLMARTQTCVCSYNKHLFKTQKSYANSKSRSSGWF